MATRDDHGTYWNATAESPGFPALSGDISVDVAIIGGGIVGVTTARLLKDRGLSVAVIEARRVGRQVTGKSTAKMSSQHGASHYQTLEKKFGEDRARLYAEAQEAGIRRISELAARHGIEADIEPMPAFVYTQRRELGLEAREGGGGREAARPPGEPHPRHRPSLRRAPGDALGRPGPVPPGQICRRARRDPPGRRLPRLRGQPGDRL